MINRIVIPDCDGEDFILEYEDDGVTTHCCDMNKLDIDLNKSYQASIILLDETDNEWDNSDWGKYVMSLCKDCGAEPGELHTCNNP